MKTVWAEATAAAIVMASFAGMALAGADDARQDQPPEPAGAKWLSFGVDYTLASDYVWRGINLSEYAGEGREKLNHQMGVSFAVDTEPLVGTDLGTVTGSVWFAWYAGQDDTAFAGGSGHLQEVDYTLSWSRDVPGLPVTSEIGWIAYQFPQVGGDDAQWTHEVYVSLALDDEAVFGQDLLNPYVACYLDVDDVRATWIELGVSHEFTAADLGIDGIPGFEPLTLTPSLVLGIDHRYYDRSGVGGSGGTGTRLANLQYGLDAGYDLGAALGLPERYGSLTLNGFVRFSDALHDAGPVGDEFWGGVTIAYGW
ncbi:MAG: hypothetical protein KGY99_09740 [Phycisphaerae bacterium]|nr:hypothetical protein [Phycisphaerae bacterium]